MADQFLIGYDTETGGFIPYNGIESSDAGDLLTAYFCVMTQDYKILEELDLKLKPDGRLPIANAGSLKVNGIDLKEHMANPEILTYSEGTKKLKEMLNKYYKKNGKFSNLQGFGYNILGFDNDFVKHFLLNKQDWTHYMHYKFVDVMQAVDHLKRWGWLPPTIGNLSSVVDYFGITMLNAHEAKSDVLMTIEIDKKIKELMESKKNGGGQQTDLIALLEEE